MIGRKLAGEISHREQKELDELLSRHDGIGPAEGGAYRQLLTGELTWEEDEEAYAAAGIYWEQHQERIRQSSLPAPAAGSGTKRLIIRLAAACVILLMLFTPFPPEQPSSPDPDYTEIVTGSQQKTRLTLPDGTRVWLNRNSIFRYDKNMNRGQARTAFLNGEAYFDVASNPQSPFVVHTDKMDIKVLGTAFNVQAYPGDSTAAATLFRGKVEVTLKEPHAGKRTVLLEPEEKLVVKSKKEQMVVNEPDSAGTDITGYILSEIAGSPRENLYKENAWVHDKVIFNNEPFSEIARFLEKKYPVKIRFKDQAMAETSLRGVFSDESIHGILEALKFTAGFEYTIQDSVVTIY